MVTKMPDMMDDLVKRYDSLMGQRNVAQEDWDTITDYVCPYRGRFFHDQRNESSIEWSRGRLVYDSTAVSAHKNLAAHIHGALTSPAIRWFQIRFREEGLNEKVKAAQWIEDVGDRIHYELQDSNFDLQVAEVYMDLCGFGTASITMDEMPGPGWTGADFRAVPLKEFCFEENAMGRVERFYRLMQWTPAQMISKFGKDGVPKDIVEADKAGNMEKHDVLFVIYPTGNKVIELGKRARADRRPWEYCYILKNSAEKLGEKGSYYEMPAFVARWLKTNSSIWGNAPSHVALGDILSLNEARKMQMKMAEKLIDPPVFAEERAIIADLDISAGALNVVHNAEGIKPWISGGNIPVSDHMITQLQEAVKDHFYVDQLTFPRPQATPMSATEAMIRQEQLAKLIGPTLGRLQNDLLDPIVGRMFRMLARAGELPPPPRDVLAGDAGFDIVYLGSLSRAQRVDEAASIERWVGSAAALAEIYPEALDVVDPDEMMRHTGRALNVPAKVMRDAEEVEIMREDRRAEQEAMQQAVIAEQQGRAMQAQGEGQEALS
jgi:hypothetical protein